MAFRRKSLCVAVVCAVVLLSPLAASAQGSTEEINLLSWGAGALVVAEILLAEAGDRYEPVRAGQPDGDQWPHLGLPMRGQERVAHRRLAPRPARSC